MLVSNMYSTVMTFRRYLIIVMLKLKNTLFAIHYSLTFVNKFIFLRIIGFWTLLIVPTVNQSVRGPTQNTTPPHLLTDFRILKSRQHNILETCYFFCPHMREETLSVSIRKIQVIEVGSFYGTQQSTCSPSHVMLCSPVFRI
jgi:hypothetical protein